MLQNYDRTISDLVKITSAGVDIASFVQVKSALIRHYKEAYGSDIDVSSTNADGIYINNTALMIHNLLQAFKNFVNGLDVTVANGVYLDKLCALANITRKPAVHSQATLTITNNSDTTISYPDIGNAIFNDAAGNNWIYNGQITLAAKTSINIIVTAEEAGPIEAPAGSIDIITNNPGLQVQQPQDASVGSNEETDAELRARRAQFTGGNSYTVLNGLANALLSIENIKDVRIYENKTDKPQRFPKEEKQETYDLLAHSIIIVIRQVIDTDEYNEQIGKTIYERLTPGIGTSTATFGTWKSYTYSSAYVNSATVQWEIARTARPTIKIPIATNIIGGADIEQNVANMVVNAIYDYTNSLRIGDTLSTSGIISAVSTILNRYNTYAYSITISDNGQSVGNFSKQDTCFDYNANNTTVTFDFDTDGKTVTSITIADKESSNG